MTAETNPSTGDQGDREESVEFGCWKWIFLVVIILVAIGVGYLVLF